MQAIQKKLQLWKNKGPEIYKYNIVRECFCSENYLKELQITVNSGHVTQVIYADSKQEVDAKIFNQQLTINQWFELALSSMNNEDGKVIVNFTSDSLYPTSIFIDPHLRRADDEYTVYVKKLTHN